MDTRTGEVFTPAQMAGFTSWQEMNAREQRKAERHLMEEHQVEELLRIRSMEAAQRAGALVPVSENVAHAMRLGAREVDRRKRRRKAARDARKRNR